MESHKLDLCFSSRFSILLIFTNSRAQILIHCNYSHRYQRVYRNSHDSQATHCEEVLFSLFPLWARINKISALWRIRPIITFYGYCLPFKQILNVSSGLLKKVNFDSNIRKRFVILKPNDYIDSHKNFHCWKDNWKLWEQDNVSVKLIFFPIIKIANPFLLGLRFIWWKYLAYEYRYLLL